MTIGPGEAPIEDDDMDTRTTDDARRGRAPDGDASDPLASTAGRAGTGHAARTVADAGPAAHARTGETQWAVPPGRREPRVPS